MENLDIVPFLKAKMEYRPASTCCGTCKHYSGADLSGSDHSLPEHCSLNPAALIPVDKGGWCKFYDIDPVKLQPILDAEKKRNEVPF